MFVPIRRRASSCMLWMTISFRSKPASAGSPGAGSRRSPLRLTCLRLADTDSAFIPHPIRPLRAGQISLLRGCSIIKETPSELRGSHWLSALASWLPVESVSRDSRRSPHIELHADRGTWLSELYGDFDSRAWGDVRDIHVPLLDRYVALAVQHAGQDVTSQRVCRHVVSRFQAHLERVLLALDGQRFNGTRFLPQYLVRRLDAAVDIDHAVDPLFQHTDPAVTHMRSIVVVAKEDRAADEAPGAIRRRV